MQENKIKLHCQLLTRLCLESGRLDKLQQNLSGELILIVSHVDIYVYVYVDIYVYVYVGHPGLLNLLTGH